MKRFLLSLAAVLGICGIAMPAYAADTFVPKEITIAKPFSDVVYFDGNPVSMSGYTIDGYTYFRLRDIAAGISLNPRDEEATFDVKYNAEENTIEILRNQVYCPVKEPAFTVAQEEKVVHLSQMNLLIDGEETESPLPVYNIDGYSFCRLRDIAGEVHFIVEWLSDVQKINVYTVVAAAKPVIYLYPEKTTDVSVKLDYAGDLTVTYPTYSDGWQVTAQPDGTLTNHADGLEYSYLFWEGNGQLDVDFSEGFVVKGEDTAAFLQKTLSSMGLTPKEYNDFIVYWLPYMQDNAYNLISFQQENYTEQAKLDIQPAPDSVLRVFMAFRPLEKPVEVTPQEWKPFERNGFTVVEWGGTEVK